MTVKKTMMVCSRTTPVLTFAGGNFLARILDVIGDTEESDHLDEQSEPQTKEPEPTTEAPVLEPEPQEVPEREELQTLPEEINVDLSSGDGMFRIFLSNLQGPVL